MCRIIALLCVAFLAPAGGAHASDVPDPDECTVEPCDAYGGVLTCPHGPGGAGPDPTAFTVTIRRFGQPLPNTLVEVVLLNASGHTVCPGAVLTGSTDEHGQASFNLAIGGCSPDGPAALRILGNSVVIRHYDRILSPDQDADGRVGLADFVLFGAGFGGSGLPCADYNNDGLASLADFVTFAACFGRECGE